MQRRHHRQRQQLAEHADDREWQRRAGDKADHRTDGGEHDHLGQIDGEDVAAGGAQRLEGGDDVAAAIDMALDGVGDADAADQQRGEADQGQELGKAVDGALELRRGIVAAANLPAGLGQGAARIVGERGRGAIVGGVIGQFYPVDPAHQAARLQQLGRAQAGFADQESRTQTDAAGQFVRLGADHAANLEGRIADRDAVADLEVEPRQQDRIGGRAERAVTLGQQIRHRHRRLERQLAEHRVGAVHRLELDQCEAAVAGARHAAQRCRDRYFPARTQKRDFVRLGFALDQGEGDVAAEQGAALARQPVAEARRDRADAGNRHHAERDAGDEHIEAAQAAAQFAQGVAQGERCPAAAGGGFGGDSFGGRS